MKEYEKIEHTADIGIRAYGKNLKELFTNALKGMMSLLINRNVPIDEKEFTVNTNGRDMPELLVNLLEEALFILNTKGFAVSALKIDDMSETSISGVFSGHNLDIETEQIAHDIKGVTFHQLEIKKYGDYYTVQIIFDV